ncbi:restriction endonuclease [Pinibacter soli]|uniref:Restriction endonuclease n=1 Tax=Pinibacter soli TaxID=3044211 RepID=A0ABT6RHD0_9BACT|nr:restriction endonuclease [Pinibacter soli]MDI3321982.1 restriction endonuclease [Pinibacter soli]
MSNRKQSWQEFEEMIYAIYKELEPHANVTHNDSILGLESGTMRQIDISVRKKIAGHEILMVIQAKDLKRAADVNVVGEFRSVLQDICAQKGILICNVGFTKAAKEYAKRCKIELCSAHDASKVNWQTKIEIPVLKTSMAIKTKINTQYFPKAPMTVDRLQIPDVITAMEYFVSKLEKDEILKTQGKHLLDLDASRLFNDDMHQWDLKAKIEYDVTHRYHFKFFTPTDYRGIKDFVSNNFKPSFIEFNEEIPFLNDGTWTHVENPDLIPLNAFHLNIEFTEIDILKKKLLKIDFVEP